MKNTRIIALLGVALAGMNSIAQADHPALGFAAGTAGPVITIPATTLPKGSGAVALRLEYLSLDAFSDAELVRFAGQDIDTHSVDDLLSPSLTLGYGLTDDLTVSLRLPYVRRSGIRQGHQENSEIEVHEHGAAQGLGDLLALGQYRFVQNPANGVEGALLFGLEMPTGATRVRDQSGTRFEGEHQPGSGSWDPLLGLAASKHQDHWALDSNLLYAFVTRGAQQINAGDRFSYNLAAAYRLGEQGEHEHTVATPHAHPTWDLILELNGEWHARQKIAGLEDPNSGGHRVYLAPGARLALAEWAAALSIGLPVFEDLHGVQHGARMRMVLGLGRAF